MEKLKSRKLWVAGGAFLFAFLTEVLGLKLEQATFDFVQNIAISYIAGQGLVDVMADWRKGKDTPTTTVTTG